MRKCEQLILMVPYCSPGPYRTLVCCMNVETSVRSNPNVACDAIVSPAGTEIIYVAPDDAFLDGFVELGRFLQKPASPE